MESLIAFQAKHPRSVVIKQFPNHLSCFLLNQSAFENPLLPLTIRGLFIDSETKDIKIRGYNKFFMESHDKNNDFIGPFEVWIKENGCLIFISIHQSSLLITTKHECHSNYTEKAKEWLMHHLERSKRSEQELIHFLTQHQVTLAFELCDDDFEEHVLEYPPEKRGLWLHGIMHNSIEFQCWDAASIEQVGCQFGFPVVHYQLFSELKEAKRFIQSHEAVGHYEGRPIEGFILRGHLLNGESHFVKFKFDQPYFLYREWRELTRMFRNGEKLPACLKFEESGYYLDWLKQYAQQDSEFYNRSNPFKPIALRQAFLKEKCFLKCPLRTVIMPVGIVGCGKTSIGLFLNALASVTHLQNDNYKKTKHSDPFLDQIVHHLDMGDSIVYMDKNNHQSPMRRSMVQTLKRRFPGIRVIVLDWKIEKENKKQLAELCFGRIVNRGQNHQTLVHGGKVNVRSVIYQFMNNRDPVSADGLLYDLIIPMNIRDSIEKSVEKVLVALGLGNASETDWIKAKSEWSHYKVNYHRNKSNPVRYYGILINGHELMSKVLETAKQDAQLWNVLNELLDKNRIISPLHVTLALNPDKVNGIAEDKQGKNSTLFDYYSNAEYSSETPVQLLKLVGTEYLLCVECKIQVETLNVYPHVTIGTVSDEYKPWLSNQVLESGHYLSIPMNGTLMGTIQPSQY